MNQSNTCFILLPTSQIFSLIVPTAFSCSLRKIPLLHNYFQYTKYLHPMLPYTLWRNEAIFQIGKRSRTRPRNHTSTCNLPMLSITFHIRSAAF